MNIFCKDTYKLLDILKKNKIDAKHSKITDNIFFMGLYNNLKNILKNIKIEKNDINIIKKNNLDNLDNLDISDSEFTSKEIKDYILNKIKYEYEVTYENNTIIYFSTKMRPPIKNIIHMMTIIKMLKILFNRTFHQKVVYFETILKKKFPKKKYINNPLGINEVNSGLTYIDLHKNGDIILFRKEEILKVLIHELIHSNLIDEKVIFSNESPQFSNLFCVNYEILLNEAVTESYALIINMFYIHIVKKMKYSYLNTMFHNEMNYSTYISSKIINNYNIKNISDIIKDKDMCHIFFPQNTNVFAYYILKNILLMNHIDYGNILIENTDSYKIRDNIGISKIINLINTKIYLFKILDLSKSNSKNNSLRLCLYEM